MFNCLHWILINDFPDKSTISGGIHGESGKENIYASDFISSMANLISLASPQGGGGATGNSNKV